VGAAALSASGTSKAQVMREAQLLAPSRTLSKPTNPHTGTIITARPIEV
jgi:hypothetical protein